MSGEESADSYDVVVVGSGAGLVGAYTAAARGLRTLVIEKTEYVGGTTAYSGAGIWLPGNAAERRAGIKDGPDIARPYLDAIVGDDAPTSLRDAFLQAGPRMIDELEDNPRFGRFVWRGVPDYFADRPGSLPQGRTIFPQDIERSALGDLEPLVRRPLWTERWGVAPGPMMTGGQALVGRALLALHETGNGTVLTNTSLERLLLEDGTIVGVEALHDGQRVTFRARRGVLLAAGGYERGGALRQQLQGGFGDHWSQGCAGNTGAALRAGIEAGAATDLLEEAWFAPGLVVPHARPVFYTSVWSGIWVNAAGQRYMNERLPYDRAGHEMLRAHMTSDVSHIPTHWVFDQRQIDNERAFASLPVDPQVPGWFDVEKLVAAGVLKRADTLEELAELIGVPADALLASVERFNGCARSGKDEQFGRGEDPWDLMITQIAGSHTDGPNPCLGVIDRPPFYAATIVLSDLGTKGGLRTDENARVLRPDGSVITGLYASGNTMAPMSGRVYPGAGVPVGSSMAFSYIAALDMVGEGR
ncbi:FAD-dependent oxidoreductase [Streptomyces sp. NPDC002896]|uniref:FAD-dependent oxidoreductase n=1 Tax=Streptomyces sp. NPDC002896 TaxID=3154438 RepID=UPI003329F724